MTQASFTGRPADIGLLLIQIQLLCQSAGASVPARQFRSMAEIDVVLWTSLLQSTALPACAP